MSKSIKPAGAPVDLMLYKSKDGTIQMDVQLERDTIWLPQTQLAELFDTERSFITKHLRNVFNTGELDKNSVCAKFAQQKVALSETFCLVSVMQPMFKLIGGLRGLPDSTRRVFALQDLRALLPAHGPDACKSVVTRLEKRGDLSRVCRGIYVLPDCTLQGSDLLGHVAARLRAARFNYISLESILSEAGVISQIPLSRITLMSSGRSSVISCGRHGEIEFVHTNKKVTELAAELTYSPRLQLWKASVALALQDMKDTRRDTGLVDWEAAREFI